MRIVVTGRNGQVVRSLHERASRHTGFEILPLGRPELDLLDPVSVRSAIISAKPDVVVSAAAYTAVDQAEDAPDVAFRVNEAGAAEVAHAARLAGAPVIHLSTDYVFDGQQTEPYTEDAATGPQCVYGASKLAGEHAVRTANPDHLILRTAWVHSPFGKNFVKTMLGLAATRDQITVVDDQHGNPTSALDIADAILTVIATWQSVGRPRPAGLFHFVDSGEATWCGFARHIFGTSHSIGGPFADVVPITTEEYPFKARRPKNSRLDCTRFLADFHHRAPAWQPSAQAVVRRLMGPSVTDSAAPANSDIQIV